MTVQPVYGLSEVGFVPELRDVRDPPGITGGDVGLVITPKGLSPCPNDHRREHLNEVLPGTFDHQMVVETFGSSSLQNGDHKESFPISTGGGTVDFFVQDIEEMTEVP